MEELLFVKHFSIIKDPRLERTKLHELIDIITIVIIGIVCGAEGWEEIEAYAEEKESWLKTFLRLPNGIPSHDTISRLFSRLDPSVFQEAFLSWVSDIAERIEGQVIAIDGKTLRGSHGRGKGKKPLHLISAWATEQHLSLGQMAVDEKSNEISAIPKLLELLTLKKAIVTIDAMGCQRKIAETIVEKQGDYVFAVKENQGKLHAALQKTYERAKALNYAGMVYSQHSSTEGDHGRIETRHCIVLPLMYLSSFKLNWQGLQSLVCIESCRSLKGGEERREKRYYISSLKPEAETISSAVRAHWRIENNLHWSLDVTFREDESRIRKANAPENIAWVRRMVLSLLKKESSFKGSMRRKRFKALMNTDYLLKVLNSGENASEI